MVLNKITILILCALSNALFSCSHDVGITTKPIESDTVVANLEIKGVSFVATKNVVTASNIDALQNVNSNWIAQMPFAFCKQGEPTVTFDANHQWWGETDEGIIETTLLARAKGIKTLLKPQIWMSSDYTGIFTCNNETDWLAWEKNYATYILHFAHLADSMNIEMFCIGTELKLVVEKRPQYWNSLIDSIRIFYSGKLVYAANWDDYKLVPFWNKLDYIGIDAYFPLSSQKIPSVNELVGNWNPIIKEINNYQTDLNKEVIFTELGYKSVDQCAFEPWNPQASQLNLVAQNNAYLAFFKSFAGKKWFKGAFLWKWYPDNINAGGLNNIDYTPQNKPVENSIKKCF